MSEIDFEEIRKEIAKGKKYTLVFLKAGPNRTQDEKAAGEIQIAHLKYLFGLRQQGKLVINGPVLDHENIRGISIYDSADKAEVLALASEDPAVKAGRLVVESFEWFSIPGATLP